MNQTYTITLKSGKEIKVNTPMSPIDDYIKTLRVITPESVSVSIWQMNLGKEVVLVINMAEIAAIVRN